MTVEALRVQFFPSSPDTSMWEKDADFAFH